MSSCLRFPISAGHEQPARQGCTRRALAEAAEPRDSPGLRDHREPCRHIRFMRLRPGTGLPCGQQPLPSLDPIPDRGDVGPGGPDDAGR
jgi:hypothetical protein